MNNAVEIASRYVTGIRNPTKREYATDFLKWIQDGRVEDKQPMRADYGLSVMAAQAVRMNLNAIIPEGKE